MRIHKSCPGEGKRGWWNGGTAGGSPSPEREDLGPGARSRDTMNLDPPDGWSVWHAADGGRVILAYRPDIFDADAYPAPCMPTVYVSPGSPRRRPGLRAGTDDGWTVTLTLEPDVEARKAHRETRAASLEAALDIAAAFAAGEVDYRAAYQVPRERYLDRLDELTGREA